ncbi:hypothetical protein DSO57_1022296 [Entomophthora muscae]|uniref:Uncharacterized protein n=1 Tax=Entomophthora muscae TaxID=34485 RepID=A0ACC2TQ97_9FUNG|nr:hypothetical protein DSO57_1022296 [Entomophthora muscae]
MDYNLRNLVYTLFGCMALSTYYWMALKPLLNLTQIPTILNTFVKLAWIDLYPKDLPSFQGPDIDKFLSTDQNKAKIMSVLNHSLPSLQHLPPMSLDLHPTWDCSLWFLLDALLMSLNTYFPHLSQPAFPWRPLRAVIQVLHWITSWWPDFVSLAPLSHTTPPNSPFVYSPSDPQEKLFDFNCHYDPTSESKEEPEKESEPSAPADDQIELWDVKSVHNICNQNGAFVVPTTFLASYHIVSKKRGLQLQL